MGMTRPPGLVLFDVDGTLCDTCDVDDELYCATASRLLGVPIRSESWEKSPQVTDSGIAAWLWGRHLRRGPRPDELERFATQFEEALATELRRAPQRFAAIAGAAPMVQRLMENGWQVAFATGGWARTARLKLRAAGLPEAHLVATSDDSPERREIFGLAYSRLATALAEGPRKTVLVGDGLWDLDVAAHFGWNFLGVASGDRARQLRDAGAMEVVASFAERDGALDAVARALAPRR